MRHAKPLILLGTLTALAGGSVLFNHSGQVHAQSSKCSLNGGALAFGTYNPGFIAAVDVMGSVALTCSGKQQVQLSMSVGNGEGASYAGGRIMTSGAGGKLRYNLYTDASRTLVLGDGTNGSALLTISVEKSFSQTLWGRIPPGQLAVEPGSYGDTLIATVSY